MTIYSISGFQSEDAPHWSTAIIEADDEASARAILYEQLQKESIETVWGWPVEPGDVGDSYQDPATWKVKPINRPLNFVLGGGCR